MARRGLTGRTFALVLLVAGLARAEETAPTPPAQEAATAEEEESAEEPPVRVSWQAGETVLEARRARLAFTNRLQVRWSGLWPAEDDRASNGSFRLRRAKSKLDGWVYTERVTFELEVDWSRTGRVLDDAFVDVDATGDGALRVTVGQFKVPFGRQELATSGKHQFLSRSITSELFTHGRDVGLMLHGDGAGGRLSWAAGVFNGSGPGTGLNPDGRYQLDARLQVAPNGDPGYAEGDLGRSPRPLYAFAVQYERDDGGLGEERRRRTTWGGDATLRYRGFFLFGEAFWSRLEPTGEPDLRRNGVALQTGWVYRSVELAGRWARWEGGPGEEQSESGIAFNWYVEGHLFKVQSDLRFLEGGLLGLDDTQLRVQTQLVF